MKNILKKYMIILMSLSMLFSIFGRVSVFAQSINYAKADFDSATSIEGEYQGMTFAYKISKGNKIGKLSLSKSDVPYYGTMLKFDQTGSNASDDNLQFMTFTLDEGIPYGDNAQLNTYAEFSADVKLQNRKTGINIELSNSTMGMTAYTYRLNIRANGELFSNNVTTGVFAPSGTNSVVNNLRIRMDMHKKAVVGIYVDDELLVDCFTSPLPTNAVTYDNIDVVKICIGNKTSTDSLYVDNVNVVTYTSVDGTSPVGTKTVLKNMLDEIDISSLTDEQKTVFDNAVTIAKKPAATQGEIDGMVEELKAFSNVTPDIPEIPSAEPFTMSENFEAHLSESEFDVIYGEGIISQEIFDDAPYGNNTLKIKTDASKKNVSQYVDFGLGKNKISFADEKPNCYVEFGIDFSCLNMSKYGKNIFVYFRDSSDTNMGNLYITGGRAIRLSGLLEGELILASIEEQETRMNNVRIVMQMTDSDGNPSGKITAVWADDVLLNANYPLHLKSGKDLATIRAMISNIKDDDFGLGKEWATNIDNMTVTKYYSEDGEASLYTKGQLVSLMRGFDAEAEVNHKDKLYSDEQYDKAKAAISSAADVYMNKQSSDEDIDTAYRELYFAKKRLEMPQGNAFDVVEVLTSSEKLTGNNEMTVDLSVITSENIPEAVAPGFAGILMKNEETADRLLDKKVITKTINPKSEEKVSMTFDLSKYTEEEKADMYIKLFAFSDIKELKPANIKLPVLFGTESETDNSLYRYADKALAYQLVEDDVVSVFTKTGESREENILLVFEKDFNIKGSDKESFEEKLVYVNTSEFDKNGQSAFAVKGIEPGEYIYCMVDNKGKFISSDKETIENALNEVQKNPEKIEDLYGVLGIDKEVYEEIKDNGVAPDKVLGEILKDNSYEVSELQVFVEDLLENLYMLNDFKSIKTVGYVRAALEKYGDRISNISKYNALDSRKTVIAEEYILDNKNDIISVGTLEELIDDAVEKAKEHSTFDTTGNSGGGGGSRHSSSVIILPENTTNNSEKEYGDIVEVHSGEFTDLDDFEWAKPAVALLAKKGSIKGKSEGIFAPKDKVTRTEFVKMILLTFGFGIEDSQSTFSDVSDDSWYKPYVMTAAKSGIVTGYSEDVFGADDNISRQDATVIIARVLKNLNIEFSENGEYIPFIDEDFIAEYAKDAVFGMAKSGIVNGVEGNYFAPSQNTTRAEAAKLIYESYMFMVTKEG